MGIARQVRYGAHFHTGCIHIGGCQGCGDGYIHIFREYCDGFPGRTGEDCFFRFRVKDTPLEERRTIQAFRWFLITYTDGLMPH